MSVTAFDAGGNSRAVENHTRNILKKLQLSRKQELMRYALEQGIE